MLPSEVRARATTFDLMVLDIQQTWEQYQQDPHNPANYDTEQLKEIVRKHNESKNK